VTGGLTASWSGHYATLSVPQIGIEEWINGNAFRYPRGHQTQQLCLTAANFSGSSASVTAQTLFNAISNGSWFVYMPTSGTASANASTVTISGNGKTAVMTTGYRLLSITDGPVSVHFSYPSTIAHVAAPKTGCSSEN
jgi:hypothetical protein